ncbi:MAG: urease accessory protein UreF [Rhodocyclaceae bacterium]|nr:urease accessory protein UreF [Rhodocyclaceae bacterium]MBX3669977.1 urease accessory protein UreF [Rhodocyclaceae bacterium]
MAEAPAAGLALARLLQLASPALPVGAYTYSQGLEWAVEAGRVRDEASALVWLGDALQYCVAAFEAPWLAQLMAAWTAGDDAQVARLNELFLASRETSELRAETAQMGYSCVRLLTDLPAFSGLPGWPQRLAQLADPSFPAAWGAAAAAWQLPPEAALTAYLWSWLENQVMAAIKAVPLGQAAGQRIAARLAERLPDLVAGALAAGEQDCSNYAPGFALASCRHETQYSRLFRS